ncbi:hypothetical protein JZ785_27410 (plasmid) [Alicyclobacillus curvatus]|jgi:uncharacterized membrane protein YsdA (DUF1294 family)|uniref:hypothetical protein n=1 Tax=Alicyclobacillus sp. SO9 TaxID=2665646 RepID=UPI0018E7B9C8|nr:hypothetical protein [Alicyclobacillus sp. SO9]QQE79588.1 hypothetical protein GI364_03585 [Alicyclobacillus sp. SO9]QQE81554.1 hypothetical protein GI364_24965 [Alicyclobacillus sp. SO9]QSO54314.1 hypothetical protein JZ785_11410 [Alicyclobacillus curvatus]QSO55487.1 hypothetical protein JZ785_27410 [Alicyclobacillus curvatus]
MTRTQRLIFLGVHFGWITLWITAIDLRGKISERTFDILLGASAGVAVLSTIFMLVVMFGNRKR